jgi:hypothetical protein
MWRLGLSPTAILLLAMLGVPRAVAHDMGPVGAVLNALLVFVPIGVWLGVVVWREVPRPFLTLLVIGLTYGVFVGLAHQLLWPWAFDSPPRLGGNLAGTLSSTAESTVLRLFAFGSSVLTGLGVGALVGLVGWGALRLRGSRPRAAG